MGKGTKGGQLTLVSPEQVEKVREAALRILEEKGIKVEGPKSRQWLKGQ